MASGKIFKVHRLVAEHFLDTWNPKLTVDHLSGDKNDNSIENLRMLSREDNARFIPKNHARSRTMLLKLPEATFEKLQQISARDMRSMSGELRYLINSADKLDKISFTPGGDAHRFILEYDTMDKLKELRQNYSTCSSAIIQTLIEKNL